MPEQGGGNFFTQKLGPLALWVWAVIALVILVGVMYWKKIGPFAAGGGSSAGSAGSGGGSFQTASPSSGSLPGMLGSQGVDLSALPQPGVAAPISVQQYQTGPQIPPPPLPHGGLNGPFAISSPRGRTTFDAHAANPSILTVSPLAPAPIIQVGQ
jgi:hypothetical protein